jgi:hypothetical protein
VPAQRALQTMIPEAPARFRLAGPFICVALVLLAAIPVAVVAVPVMTDLPNHIARHHLFAVHGTGGPLDQFFELQWRWIGNLGVDLPVMLLGPYLGAEAATRLVVALIAPLTVAGILALSRAAHGRVTASAAIALPFALAQPFLWGFVNYCLGVALALLVAAAWLRRPPRSVAALTGFALASLAVFTAHMVGWAVMMLPVAGAELASVKSVRDAIRRCLRAAPLLVPVIPMLLWRGSGDGQFSYRQDVLEMKVMNFVTMLKGLSLPFDLAFTAVLLLVAMAALLVAAGRRIEPRLAAGAGFLLLASLTLPAVAFGAWGADLRITPVAVMVAIMAIGPATSPARERTLFAIGAALFALRTGWTTVTWVEAQPVLAERLSLLDDVPRGSRMGFAAVADSCRAPWVLTPDRHIASYAVARRDAFTNTLFTVPGSDIMQIRDPADRVRWFDRSQDVAALCPQGVPDKEALAARLDEMAAAGFDWIWIAGIAPDRIARPDGYAVVRALHSDVLIARRP